MRERPIIQFDVRTPCSDEAIREHVVHALSLKLAEAMPAQFPRSHPHLKVIAGGPSALKAELDGPTLAVNNALKLFTDQGKAPTYWAGCDPQAHLADFLKNPPTNTIYLVASKCHQDVFKALKHRKVLVWHIDDPCIMDLMKGRAVVQTACSITLTSFNLMEMLGYQTFDTWGWDGCYIDGKDHANDQIHAGSNINVVCGAKTFKTTTSWALEAEDACNKLPAHNVTINGPGMIGEIVRFRQALRAA